MKMKKYLIGLLALSAIGLGYAANTDIFNFSGQGIYAGKDMFHLDSNYDLRSYNGDIILGDNGLAPTTNNSATTPSISVGGFYGLKVPFFNGSGASTAIGSVILASTTFNSATVSEGTMASVTATTTIMGVSDGVYANGTVGYMTISGYALTLTTGAVTVGQILVSSAGTSGVGPAGLAGATSGTQVVGTGIGKALTTGAATGGLVLTLVNIQ